jgi:hypothetical protein
MIRDLGMPYGDLIAAMIADRKSKRLISIQRAPIAQEYGNQPPD